MNNNVKTSTSTTTIKLHRLNDVIPTVQKKKKKVFSTASAFCSAPGAHLYTKEINPVIRLQFHTKMTWMNKEPWKTPGCSWTHLLVPCCLAPSCSCIQTLRLLRFRPEWLRIHSSSIEVVKTRGSLKQTMTFRKTRDASGQWRYLDQCAFKQNTLALHPQLSFTIQHSCE